MTCTVCNLTRRIVSFRGNSGQTWHLPPGVSIPVLDVEVARNAKVVKLEAMGVIAVQRGGDSNRDLHARARSERAAAQ